MITIRSEARRKGLRMAAHVAALSGVLAAAAAASQAGAAQAKETFAPSATAGDSANASDGAGSGAGATAERLGDLVRVSSKGNCGCAPCWGPPAPPAMREELLSMFDDVTSGEVAS